MKIAIITDIHENADLLSESLRMAEAVKCDEIACLGDIVGYDKRFFDYESKRSASESIRLIRSSCKWVVAGNHDINAAHVFPSWSNGFTYPADWFGMDPQNRKKLSRGKIWSYEGDSPNDLKDEDIDFLRKIPEFIITGDPGVPCLFSHYFAPDFTGSTTVYIERKAQLNHHWKILRENNVSFSFTGHSHNSFAGFAYMTAAMFTRAIQSFPGNTFYLGNEQTAVILPPLTGDKGKRGFTVLDTGNHQIRIINL